MLKNLIVASIILFSVVSANATTPPPFPPPTRYDHPFKGERHIIEVGPWTLLWKCRLAYACTPIGGEAPGQCTTTILPVGSKPVLPWSYTIDADGYKELIRHETAHCNGWPANHPK